MYIGNGMEAIPDEMFKIKPVPLWKEDKCLRVGKSSVCQYVEI